MKLGRRLYSSDERVTTAIGSMVNGTIGGQSKRGMPVVEVRRMPLVYEPAAPAFTCPSLVGEISALDNLHMIGDALYGATVGSFDLLKLDYPTGAITTIYDPATGGGGAARVVGFALAPDGTGIFSERIPAGTTSNGQAGPTNVLYRLNPDESVTFLMTIGFASTTNLAYSTATGEFYWMLSGTLYEVDPATGGTTAVATPSTFSEHVETTDGAFWCYWSNTEVRRIDPTTWTEQPITIAASSSNYIPIGTSIWVPGTTGQQVDADGTVTTHDCMTGFLSVFDATYDYEDPDRSVLFGTGVLPTVYYETHLE